jgi:hypothetical protein
MTMTDTTELERRLLDLVELAGKATPGPWFDSGPEDWPGISSDAVDGNVVNPRGRMYNYDRELIVALRNAIPYILSAADEIGRLRASLEAAKKHLISDATDSVRRSRAMGIIRAALTPPATGRPALSRKTSWMTATGRAPSYQVPPSRPPRAR